MPELKSSRWEEFARQRACGKSLAQAWLDAGFNAKSRRNASTSGSTLEKRHPEVKARAEELRQEIATNAAKRAEVDREFVLGALKKNHEKASQEKPVLDRQGKTTGEFQFSGAVSNRALELMGKELGMFADIHKFESLDHELEGMNRPELLAMIKVLASEVGLRVMEMNDDETRAWIAKHGPRVGLRVTPSSENTRRLAASEDSDLHSVPEAGRIPPGRIQ